MPYKTSETEPEPVDQTEAPQAVLCHRTAGRFRLRVAERRNDEAYLGRVREALEQHASVLEVATTPLTGSVLVLHRGDEADVLASVEASGLFRVTRERDRTLTIVHWLDELDRFDTDFLFARMNEKPQRAAIGLFMLAVLQALRGSFLPSAPSLLGEAMGLLREGRARANRDKRRDD
jgi:hypothetical protein